MSSKSVHADRSPDPPEENRRDRELLCALVARVMRLPPLEEHGVRIVCEQLPNARAVLSKNCPPIEQWIDFEGIDRRILTSQLRENAFRAALGNTGASDCLSNHRALFAWAAVALADGEHGLMCDVRGDLELELKLARDDYLDEQTQRDLMSVVLSCGRSTPMGPDERDRLLWASLLRLKTSSSGRIPVAAPTDLEGTTTPSETAPILEVTMDFENGSGSLKRVVLVRGAKRLLPDSQLRTLSRYVVAKRNGKKLPAGSKNCLYRLRNWLSAHKVTGTVDELNLILETAKGIPLPGTTN
jgi:hypothetical protein